MPKTVIHIFYILTNITKWLLQTQFCFHFSQFVIHRRRTARQILVCKVILHLMLHNTEVFTKQAITIPKTPTTVHPTGKSLAEVFDRTRHMAYCLQCIPA